MHKFRVEDVEERVGSTYPAPFDAPCRNRISRGLSATGGLTQFGVNHVRLSPGAWSSQRHWHTHEDELVLILEGQAMLVTDEGETLVKAGDVATFPAGKKNGHHLQNRFETDCVFIAIGSRNDEDRGEYPDIDLRAAPGRYSGPIVFTDKEGRPYPKV